MIRAARTARSVWTAAAAMAALGALAAACTQWRVGPGDPAWTGGPPASGSPSAPGARPDPPQPIVVPPSDLAIRGTVADVWVHLACASAKNPDGRWSEPTFVRKGLAAIVDDHVLPRYRLGYRRFYVDSPFGKDTDEKGIPQFTFFGALRVGQESPWRRGFVGSWWRATRLSGIKVIAYMGNPYTDAEFKRVLAGPDGRTRAMKMLRDAVAPIIDAGFQGIGIDASFDTDEDSPLGDLMKEWRRQGLEVFIEGPPLESRRWLTQFGVIRTTWLARNTKPGGGLVDVRECRGERIQLFEGTPPWPEADGRPFEDWARRWVRECFARGERPAMGIAGFKGDPKRVLGVE